MAQVYGIPQYPVISPLAGLADLYKMYTDEQRLQEDRKYNREKDTRDYMLKQQEVNDNRDYRTNANKTTELYYSILANQGAAKHAWDVDPNNPDNQYKIAAGKAAQLNADVNSRQVGLQEDQYNLLKGMIQGQIDAENVLARQRKAMAPSVAYTFTPGGYVPITAEGAPLPQTPLTGMAPQSPQPVVVPSFTGGAVDVGTARDAALVETCRNNPRTFGCAALNRGAVR